MGRRVPIAISAIFIVAPAIGSGCSTNWWQLLLCRILLGLGMGKSISNCSLSEVADQGRLQGGRRARVRGRDSSHSSSRLFSDELAII